MAVGAEDVALRFGAGAHAGNQEAVDRQGRQGECRQVVACNVDVGQQREKRYLLQTRSVVSLFS